MKSLSFLLVKFGVVTKQSAKVYMYLAKILISTNSPSFLSLKFSTIYVRLTVHIIGSDKVIHSTHEY